MEKNQQITRYIVLFFLLILAITGTLSYRALYADGPFWLYQMLISDGFYIFDMHRAFAQYVVEWPVYLAIKFGVQDLNVLMRLYSFGFIAIPIFFWSSALIIQFRTPIFWLLALACSVTYLRSGFFAVGEFNTAYGLVALSISIILKEEASKFLALILFLSAVVLIYSYESMLFLGIVLFSGCAVRLFFEKNDTKVIKLVLIAAGCAFLLSAFVGVRSTFFYRDENLQATINYGALFEPHILYLIGMIFFAIFTLLAQLNKTFKILVTIFSALISLIYIFYVWRWERSGISYGFYSYAYRSLGAFMLAGILCISYVVFYFPRIFKKIKFISVNTNLLSYVVTIVFIVQGGILLFHTFGYYRWLQTFEHTALTVEGLVPIDKTALGAGYGGVAGYNWPWSNSTLSVLLRGNAESIVTNASNFNGWETFDPRVIEKYPLKQYFKSKSISQ